MTDTTITIYGASDDLIEIGRRLALDATQMIQLLVDLSMKRPLTAMENVLLSRTRLLVEACNYVVAEATSVRETRT